MNIKIEQINVKNLGPIDELSITLKQVNLIYGRNEHGKTYLVEFIYKMLFKNMAINLRDSSATGQLTVSGLEENETIFSSSKKKKLESFLEGDHPGLPKNFSKLLVVKGADLDFSSNSPAGIDDAILKEFLSGEGLLDNISKQIKSTESTATYKDGKITGQKKGILKDYYELQEDIGQIDAVMKEVNMNISGGKRLELSQRILGLEKAKKDQEQARNHLAYILSGQASQSRAQLDRLPEDLINKVDKLIHTYNQKKIDHDRKQKELEENREKSRDFHWLESATNEYQKLIQAGSSQAARPGMVWLILSAAAITLSVILVLLRQNYIGVAGILLAVLFFAIYLRNLNKGRIDSVRSEEIERIVADYKNRFGDSAVVQESTLSAKKSELQPIFFSIEALEKDVRSLAGDLTEMEKQITDDLRKLPDSKDMGGGWQEIINALYEKRRELVDQKHKTENEFSRLGIAEEDFVQEATDAEYDAHLLKSTSDELENVSRELNKTDRKLQELKQAICGITGEAITCEFDTLIESLIKRREDLVDRYKGVTATILARIKVSEVLVEMRTIEDERIADTLSSKTISEALRSTTIHYDRLEKEEGELFVADSYNRYRVADLSTSAREQVLLGLRIGFASRQLAGTPLFLILDDAFQHSDWERRDQLVRKLFDLSKAGWQIIYFTMDDHIRSLFETNARESGEDQYQTIALPSIRYK